MELYPIIANHFKLDGGAMFGVVPKSLWSKQYPADENNMIPMVSRCLLVVDGERRILIDNGFGNKQDDRFLKRFYLHGGDTLEKSLAAVGFSFDDITDMFYTHLHFDHCGGGLKFNAEKTAIETVFKNATYWVSSSHWDWANNPNAREKASFLRENILPLDNSDQLRLFEGNQELFPNFYVRLFNGHTNGQAIPFINYHGRIVVFMADLLPFTVHIPLPWIMSYDTRPLLTLKEKEHFLAEALEKDYILFFEHDAFYEACNLHSTPKGVRPHKTFLLRDGLEADPENLR